MLHTKKFSPLILTGQSNDHKRNSHTDLGSGPSFKRRIDRSGMTVGEYLHEPGAVWTRSSAGKADILLFKEMTGGWTPRKWFYHFRRRCARFPYLSLIGEAREFAGCAYRYADGRRTLAVAPAKEFSRLFFALEWLDPQLEDWPKRMDRICWIGRPLPKRVEWARQIIEAGLPLDIYSREPWPFPNWKGFAHSEVDTSRRYRYRIVCENSVTHGYHSEKFFGSLRCGCVTFYHGDTALDLAHVTAASLPLSLDHLLNREAFSQYTLDKINHFMFGSAWEIYSYRSFYDRIISRCRKILEMDA